jgi:hypothetical protein
MRVVVTLTIGERETVLEGDAAWFDRRGGHVDKLERRGVGFWLSDWRYLSEEGKGSYHKSRVFCPWSSVLMVETSDGKEQKEG